MWYAEHTYRPRKIKGDDSSLICVLSDSSNKTGVMPKLWSDLSERLKKLKKLINSQKHYWNFNNKWLLLNHHFEYRPIYKGWPQTANISHSTKQEYHFSIKRSSAKTPWRYTVCFGFHVYLIDTMGSTEMRKSFQERGNFAGVPELVFWKPESLYFFNK